MRYIRKKQRKKYGVCFYAEKNGMCTRKIKMRKVNIHTKYTELQNTEFTEIGSG